MSSNIKKILLAIICIVPICILIGYIIYDASLPTGDDDPYGYSPDTVMFSIPVERVSQLKFDDKDFNGRLVSYKKCMEILDRYGVVDEYHHIKNEEGVKYFVVVAPYKVRTDLSVDYDILHGLIDYYPEDRDCGELSVNIMKTKIRKTRITQWYEVEESDVGGVD